MKSEDPDDVLSVEECAEYAHVSPGAIISAIHRNRIPSFIKKGKRYLLRRHYDAYRLARYCREKLEVEGDGLFDLEEGKLSVEIFARIVSAYFRRLYTRADIYNLLHYGVIKGEKSGKYWIIPKEEAVKFVKREEQRLGAQAVLDFG